MAGKAAAGARGAGEQGKPTCAHVKRDKQSFGGQAGGCKTSVTLSILRLKPVKQNQESTTHPRIPFSSPYFPIRAIVSNLSHEMKLQALRIEAGWRVKYNQFYELDPQEGWEDYFEGSSLLMLENSARLKLIDVEWRPERDINGAYRLQVLNFRENFRPQTNQLEIDPDWEKPFLCYATRSRMELVEKLEDLMRSLPAGEDPRILSARGVVSQPSESFRLELAEKGPSLALLERILTEGNAQIQILLLDHKELSRAMVLELYERGVTKKVRNKAQQKLNSRGFRE